MPLQQNKIIELLDVTARYDNRVVFSDVSLTVSKGDFLAITGPNGGGKTTLLRLMLGLLTPDRGSVTYFLDGSPVKKLGVGYLPQKNKIDSRFPVTVEEVVGQGLMRDAAFMRNRLPATEVERVREIVRLVGLSDFSREPIGNLSGGQLQRALFARAIISNPPLLVLDEPLSYLDKAFEARLYDIISQIAASSTIVLVSHEMTHISQMANRHVIVDHNIHDCHAAHHYIRTDCE